MTSRDTSQMTPGYWYDAKSWIASAANEYDLSYRDFFFGFENFQIFDSKSIFTPWIIQKLKYFDVRKSADDVKSLVIHASEWEKSQLVD